MKDVEGRLTGRTYMDIRTYADLYAWAFGPLLEGLFPQVSSRDACMHPHACVQAT